MAIQRRAELEIARKQLTDCSIRAPFDGVIQSRPASIGEYIAVNTPIVTLVKINPLRLRLEVPERLAPLVKMGQQIHLALDSVSQVYTGSVTRLSPAIDAETRMLFIEADLPNAGLLRPGSFVRAQIIVNEQEESLSVPLNALVSFAGIEKVVLFQEGTALERTVTTGRRGTNWVELRSGVTKGDLVVLNPTGVRSGQKLTTKVTETPAEKSKPVKKQHS
jgi:RND family efflux transporter MFP subunit